MRDDIQNPSQTLQQALIPAHPFSFTPLLQPQCLFSDALNSFCLSILALAAPYAMKAVPQIFCKAGTFVPVQPQLTCHHPREALPCPTSHDSLPPSRCFSRCAVLITSLHYSSPCEIILLICLLLYSLHPST